MPSQIEEERGEEGRPGNAGHTTGPQMPHLHRPTRPGWTGISFRLGSHQKAFDAELRYHCRGTSSFGLQAGEGLSCSDDTHYRTPSFRSPSCSRPSMTRLAR